MNWIKFSIVTVLIEVTLLLPIFISREEIQMVTRMQQAYTLALENAVDDALFQAVETDSVEDLFINRDVLSETFFHSLYINMGCPNDQVLQGLVQVYVPLLVLVEEDGFYVNYTSEIINSDGYHVARKTWSEKYPYSYTEDDGARVYRFSLGKNKKEHVRVYDTYTNDVYEDDYRALSKLKNFSTTVESYGYKRSSLLCDGEFDTIRRTAIIQSITEVMVHYLNEYNRIAHNSGITYQFSLPYISEDDWARTIDDVSFLAIFQGYPYQSANPSLGAFNRYALGGAKAVKGTTYHILERAENGQLMYHEAGCEALQEDIAYWSIRTIAYESAFGKAYEDPYKITYESNKECALQGAYPCPECMP